jgi:1-acyl-sn-glycerol-3-phosphate acyltransferase
MPKQTRRRMHFVYYFGRVVIRILIFFFASWKVEGKKNLPKDQPVLIVCNHLHIADPPIIAASIPLRLKFMAKDDLWDNAWNRFWVSNFGAFPVRRDAIDTEAIRSAERALNEGFSVIIFPEGGRARDAQMKPALPGAALIASRMKVPLLPVSITGSEKLRNLKSSFFRHPKVTVNIGQPFNLPPHNGRLPRERRQEMADYIMYKIAELLPLEYRGAYGTAPKTDN